MIFCLLMFSADDTISAIRKNIGELHLYKNQEKENSRTHFSLEDVINVEVRLFQLKKGDYSLITEWFNPLGELQQKSSYDFRLVQMSDYTVISYQTCPKAV